MQFDFDRPIDRRRTNAVKWDGMADAVGVSPDDGLAMWVADMDFEAPPAVNATLHRLAEHGVHGYYGDDRAYRAAVTHWMATRHGWHIDPDWIVTVPGLVAGTAVLVQALTEPGDGVALFTPVYHAFHRVLRANDRRIVECPMRLRDGLYEMDLDALAAQAEGVRMAILCSPHNPGGRVWTRAEIAALAEACAARDIVLVSDEVWMDVVYPGHTHVPAMTVAPAPERVITMTGPSKTFGINGALDGQLIIPDAAVRERVAARARACGMGPNRLSKLMATAAFAHSAAWVDALVAYLDGNRQTFDAGINALPGIRSMPLQGTYLAWVDFSGTGMGAEEVSRRVARDAKIGVNAGPTFGLGGESFLRFNFATRRALVADAIERMEHAFADLQ